MNWEDLDLENENDKSKLNWKNRYKYVISQINDLQYILSKGHFKKVGQIYMGKCIFPNHHDKTASLAIYPPETIVDGKQQGYTSFYCYGCGEGGDLINFYKLINSLDSKQEACKALEKEIGINIQDEDIQTQILKDSLKEINNENYQTMNLNMINMICSRMCKNYLNWVKKEYKNNLKEEFNAITAYYKQFDEEILEMTVNESIIMINKTSDFINKRRNELINKNQ